jgi:hypothetical protein
MSRGWWPPKFGATRPIEALESRTDSTAAAIAAVNGIYGDVLTDQESPLAGAMTIRCGDKPAAVTTEALAKAYPAATNRVAVFVHGWCLTEQSWSRRPVEAEDGRSYGERLRDDLGYQPGFSAVQHRTACVGQWPHACRNPRSVARPVAGPHHRARPGRPFDGRSGCAQRMPLRGGAAARLGQRRQSGGVSGLAASGYRSGERREHRVVGVSPLARNPRYRNLFERSQRRRERPAVWRVSRRGLARRRSGRVSARSLP